MSAAAAARPAALSGASATLIGFLTLFQLADYITTGYALAHSSFAEANPAMAWCFSSLGIFGLAFAKVVLLGFAALAVHSIPRWSLALMVLISAVAAGSNLIQVAPLLIG
ncbi:MAG TPA: DUF5658 family protein [Stellaceae bacterium]|nr:DUF5658 family protein [Stellaceae bacterium]